VTYNVLTGRYNNIYTSICKAQNVSIRAESEAPRQSLDGEDG